MLEPEVAGELGPETEMDTSQHPPIVHRLQYIFNDWLGDSLLESFPVFIVTEDLAQKLAANKLSGFELDKLKVVVSPEFKESEKFRKSADKLPGFRWLKIVGKEKEDDFSIYQNNLIVSEKALEVLKSARLNHCDISAAQ